MKIRMEQKGIDHAIIQRCTPINESDKEKKEFYEQLQAELEGIPRQKMKMAMKGISCQR